MAVLYVVATPIGNLDDITLRALNILKSVDIIAAESIGSAKRLLSAYGISGKKIVTVREDRRDNAYQYLRQLLDEGMDVALISDAGTPGISDPGNGVVDRLLKDGYEVVPIPGPSSLTAALSVFPVRNPWVFLGFLPKKRGKRKKLLEHIYNLQFNMVFFESPYKVVETLHILEEIMPEVELCVGREITKKFEEFIVGTPSHVVSNLEERSVVKGEFVCVIRVNK